MTKRRRPKGLFAFASFVALSAFGGTIGLATGALDLGHEINQRLPLHSPVLGGFALAILVGWPAVVVAALAWRRDTRVGVACIAAGVLLIGWIVIEVAFIRELAFLQLFYLVVGAVFIAVGRRANAGLHP